jgi:hypothetical protein
MAMAIQFEVWRDLAWQFGLNSDQDPWMEDPNPLTLGEVQTLLDMAQDLTEWDKERALELAEMDQRDSGAPSLAAGLRDLLRPEPVDPWAWFQQNGWIGRVSSPGGFGVSFSHSSEAIGGRFGMGITLSGKARRDGQFAFDIQLPGSQPERVSVPVREGDLPRDVLEDVRRELAGRVPGFWDAELEREFFGENAYQLTYWAPASAFPTH